MVTLINSTAQIHLFNSDGRGKFYFRNKTIVFDKPGLQLLLTGQTYRISMEEFDLIRELGRGQYGLVLLVRHLPSGRLMALKDLCVELSGESMKNILMELDVLRRAESPFILEFFGAFHNHASVFFCVEYMDAGSLETQCNKRGPISEHVLAAITFPVLVSDYSNQDDNFLIR